MITLAEDGFLRALVAPISSLSLPVSRAVEHQFLVRVQFAIVEGLAAPLTDVLNRKSPRRFSATFRPSCRAAYHPSRPCHPYPAAFLHHPSLVQGLMLCWR